MQFINDAVREAVIGVFDTMLSLRLEALEVAEGILPASTAAGIVGSVGMAGKINGTVYMSYPDRLACAIVEKMIGEAPAGVDQPEVTDVIGELANMVGVTRETATRAPASANAVRRRGERPAGRRPSPSALRH